jgi:hypothetical protein
MHRVSAQGHPGFALTAHERREGIQRRSSFVDFYLTKSNSNASRTRADFNAVSEADVGNLAEERQKVYRIYGFSVGRHSDSFQSDMRATLHVQTIANFFTTAIHT